VSLHTFETKIKLTKVFGSLDVDQRTPVTAVVLWLDLLLLEGMDWPKFMSSSLFPQQLWGKRVLVDTCGKEMKVLIPA
jgi:hypothetical protein